MSLQKCQIMRELYRASYQLSSTYWRRDLVNDRIVV
jgi:hypothetical protein